MLRWKTVGAPELYRDLAAMTVAGALALVPCTLIAGWLAGAPALAAVLCGMAGTLTLFAGVKFVRPGIKLLPGATAAALSGAALGLTFPVHPVLGCLSFGALFGLAQASGQPDPRRRLTVIATTAVAALIGGAVFGQAVLLLGASTLAHPAAAAALSGLFGFYMGLGTLPAHVRARRDLVGQRYAELSPGLSPEVRDHMQRTYAVYQRIQSALVPGEKMTEGQEEAFSQELERLTLKIFELASRWNQLDVHIGRLPAGDLEGRMRALDQQIAACADPTALVSYQETRRALVERSGDQAELARARERIASSLVLYFTRLEALHLTLVRLSEARDEDAPRAIEGLVASVTQLTSDMDAATRSLDQLAAPGRS